MENYRLIFETYQAVYTLHTRFRIQDDFVEGINEIEGVDLLALDTVGNYSLQFSKAHLYHNSIVEKNIEKYIKGYLESKLI